MNFLAAYDIATHTEYTIIKSVGDLYYTGHAYEYNLLYNNLMIFMQNLANTAPHLTVFHNVI